MELPLEVDFEAPTRDDVVLWLRALRSWRGLLATSTIAVALAGGIWLYRHFTTTSPANLGSLTIATTPDQAYLSIDGQPHGRTPGSVSLAAGRHAVSLTLPGFAPQSVLVELQAGRHIDIARQLWPANADVLAIHPPLPGSRIDATAFQDDGSLALDVELSSDEHQLWLVDRSGSYRQLGLGTHGSIALSGDGSELAFVDAQGSATFSSATRNAVWLADPQSNDRRLLFALSGDQALSQLSDLSWAPGQHRLLAVATDQGTAGSGRSRLLVLSDSAAPRQVIAVPAMVVPGSETWSSDGRQVAFLAKSGSATSLCLLNIADGSFRYLADTGGTSDQLPVAEVAWAPDDNQVFFTSEESGQNVAALWPFGGSPAAKLYATPRAGGPTHQVSAAQLRSPVGLADGTLLGFGRGKGGTVYLQSLAQGLAPVPVSSVGLQRERFAARWDVARQQALLVTSGSSSDGSERIEMWLVRFTPGGQA